MTEWNRQSLATCEMYHWEFGIYDGTKSCCIQAFVNDRTEYIPSGKIRGGRVHIDKDYFSVYVPCPECMESE